MKVLAGGEGDPWVERLARVFQSACGLKANSGRIGFDSWTTILIDVAIVWW